MHKMKFTWKLVIVIVSAIVFGIWYVGAQYRNIPMHTSPMLEEEIQLKLASQCKKWHTICITPNSDLPVVYAVTPTFTRPVQKAELTRLSQSFRLVSNFHWIVVEDSSSKTVLVENLLKHSNLNYTHLAAATPTKWKLQLNEPKGKKPRGVTQRNAALDWLRSNLTPKHRGVLYFADDDNTYSSQVFEEMRDTKGVSVWPVGLAAGLMVEKCIVNSTTGHVSGWNAVWRTNRPFPLDMAGFAINLQLFLSKPNAKFSFDVAQGYQESTILSYLTTKEELEPKADNCTKVYVWHTRTEAPRLHDEMKLLKAGKEKTNKNIEV